MNEKKTQVSNTTIALGIYFMLLPLDSFNIGAVGSLLKVYVLIPLVFAVLEGGVYEFYLNRLSAYLIVFLSYIGISIIYSINSNVSESAFKTILLNVCLVIVVGNSIEFNDVEIEFLKRSLIMCGWVTAGSMLLFGTYSNDGRLILTYGESTQDANYTNGYMLFAFSYYMTNFFKKKKIKFMLPMLFFLVIVLMTGSRGALLAYIICFLVEILCVIKNSERPIFSLFIAVLGAVGLLLCFSLAMKFVDPSISERFSAEYIEEHGTTGRTDIWEHLLLKYSKGNIGRKLFGYGIGTTRLLNTLRGSVGGLVAHNLYIDNLISIGIIGVLLQLCIHIKAIKEAFKTKCDMLFCAYSAFMMMSFSLSLINYKPIWSSIIMFLIINRERDGYSKC